MRNTNVLKAALSIQFFLLCSLGSFGQGNIDLAIYKYYSYPANSPVGSNQSVTVQNLPGTPTFSQTVNTNSSSLAQVTALMDATPPHQWRISTTDPCTGSVIYDTISTTGGSSLYFFFYVCRTNCRAGLSISPSNTDRLKSIYGASVGYQTSTTVDFGDGNHAAGPAVSHFYNHVYATGSYLACVHAQNNSGCSDDTCASVSVSASATCSNNLGLHRGGSHLGVDSFYIQSHVFDYGLYGNIVEYLVTFGDGSSDTITLLPDSNNYIAGQWYAATHAYQLAGIYTVCITENIYSVNHALLCTSSYCDSNTISYGPPGNCTAHYQFSYFSSNREVDFSANYSSGASNPSNYSWDLGDGTTATGANPYHIYNPGTYTVCLTVSDGLGCQDTYCDQITIPYTSACRSSFSSMLVQSGQYLFEAHPEGNPSSWLWNFGDGTTSTQYDVVHTFNTPGNYNVCLTITRSTCSDSYCELVNSSGGSSPCNASFTYNNTGTTYHFQNSSTGSNLTYFWYFGDANTSTLQSPSHTYSTAGTYPVYLIISNGSGCNDTTFRTLTVSTSTNCMAYFGQTNTANVYTFTDYSQGSNLNYSWSFGDGGTSIQQAPVHTYSASGTYNTCLVIVNTATGCLDTFCRNITVTVPISCQAYYYYTNSQNVYSFHDTSTGTNLNYSWDFGDGGTSTQRVVSHTYTTSGTYNVCDIISNTSTGCRDTFCRSITVTVPTSCQAYFSYSNQQNVYTFTNNSQGTSLNYYWYFGDGSTSTQQNPTHTYTTAGAYNACLYIANNSGCSDTFCRSISVSSCNNTLTLQPGTSGKDAFISTNDPNSIGGSIDRVLKIMAWTFNTVPGTRRSLLEFDLSSIPSGATITDARLSLYADTVAGLGHSSQSGSNAAYIQRVTSAWTESTVTWNNQPPSTTTNQVTLAQSTSSNQDYTNVNVTALVQDMMTSGNFGFLLRLQTESYYRSMIFGSSDNANAAKRPKLVVTYCLAATPCQAYFYYNNTQNVYTFHDTSTGTNLNYSWTFGDGGTSTQRVVSHTYTTSGTYNVCDIISNTSTGCRDTFCRTITVTVPTSCLAYFGTTNTQNAYAFTNYSQGNNLSYSWTFGDGTSSTLQNPTHTYSSSGTYYPCLVISNTSGCRDTFCRTLTVAGSTVCNAYFNYTYAFGSYSFNNYSTGTNLSYFWRFGDGYTSSLQNPTHVYSAGTYTACLFISNNAGCVDSFCRTITVTGVSTCNAYFYYTNQQNVYTFNDYSQGSSLSYYWSFGDGNTSTLQNPTHTYSAGTYTACLFISSASGCSDTMCRSITVTGTTTGCSASFTYSNQQHVYSFQNTSTGTGLTHVWNFGDGNMSTTQNPTHTYAPGTYTACLMVGNNSGCHDTTCSTFTVVGTTSCNAAFSYTVSGNDVTFNNTSSNFTSSYWTFGDNTAPSTQQNPTHTYAQNGTYQVCLTTIDTSGCSDNICQNLLISTTSQQLYCLYGRVSKGTATNAAFPATVYLVYKDTAIGTLTAVRTTQTNASGNYSFCGVPVGRYLVKAALNQGATGYSTYIPTYYGNSLFWSYATELTLNHNLQQVDIWLIAGNNQGGPGFVGGYTNQGANKMEGLGDPVPGIQVMLLDEYDNPVQYIYSDENGRWDFSNVAYGTYKVYAEVLGIPTYPYLVTIGPDNETVDNVELVIEKTQVISDVVSLNANLQSVKIYPNPTNDMLNIDLSLLKDAELNVSITDVTGKQVIEEILHAQAGNQALRFNLAAQSPGVYFVRIAGKDNFKTFKVMKY